MKKFLLIILTFLLTLTTSAQIFKTYQISFGCVILEHIYAPESYIIRVFNDTDRVLNLDMGDFNTSLNTINEMINEMNTTSIGSRRVFKFINTDVEFMRLIEQVAPYAPAGVALPTFEAKAQQGPNYILTLQDLEKLRKALLKSQKKKK